ncbi:MAG: YdeI/OmpD-associated family protein [Gemmatimonadota bacterium]|nr:YdeI/OmpD-associated family protein [Gemmatimonadota bacterium]
MRSAIRGTSATNPRFFRSAAEFRAWLARNHARVSELWLGFHNARSDRRGISYPAALDEALCQGWVDGVRKSLDHTRYVIRFTPRKPVSQWSAVNVRHARRLIQEGRMQTAGRAAFDRRPGDRAGYSFESRPRRLAPEFARRLRAHGRAWAFFRSQAPGYRRVATFWVMSAKRPETRERRFATLLRHSAKQERVPPLSSAPRPGTDPK